MSLKFYRVSLAATLVALACAAFPGVARATHSWNGYHWARTSNPFTVQLGDNVSSAWDSYLATASTDWVTTNLLYPTIVSGSAGSNLRKCPPTKGRVEVCNYRYGTNGWLGVAQIWLTGGHIYQGTVKLNDSYFDNSRYPQYNTPAWRRLVMCQEIGHTFGLDHQDETFNNPNLGTCMDYTSNPAGPPSNEHPNAHDYDELGIIYSHGDSTTTAGQIAQNGPGRGKTPPADLDSDEPVELGTAQWGKLIRSTNRGRTELYELDLGGGHKILTRVIWAEPEEEPGPQRGRRR
ncbi:MAG TPA: hypothetical protein VNM15_06190 [Candidatus Binatia bacterium]|nr:hypothetical protein [Candidatus Binatia bacterium]